MSSYPLIKNPTRFSSTTNTLIDHIHCNNTALCRSTGILLNDISDHLLIIIIYNNNTFKIKSHNPNNIRLINDKTIVLLNTDIMNHT